MIEKTAQHFYARNPSLASLMVDWSFCNFASALLFAITLFLATKISFSQLILLAIFYATISVFLETFEASLKALIGTYSSPQNLRKIIQKKLKNFTKEKIKQFYLIAFKVFRYSEPVYAVLCCLIENLIGRTVLTIIFFCVFESSHLLRTEIEQLNK